MNRSETVGYHELRPRDLVERREARPVAYFGLGILEWHGLHNPLGLDGLKADEIAVSLAKELGGVAMPPLFWGDNRRVVCELVFDPDVSPWLPDGTPDHTRAIASHMGISLEDMEANAVRAEREGGWRLWKELILHSLFQIQTFGFKAVVLIPGHYPLVDPLEESLAAYRKEGGKMESLVLTDEMYAEDGSSGDHAAAFETSLLMALRPELVDLSELDPDPGSIPVGVLGDDPRTGASAEFGRDIMRKFTTITRNWLAELGM
jgi:creatinine amidohydrolase